MARLLDSGDSVLAVIDAQPGFFETPSTQVDSDRQAVVARIAWLVGVATALGIPIVITEEDPDRNGPTAAEVLQGTSRETPAPFRKPAFGLAEVPEILGAIEVTSRRTVVLAGFETDVCVAQSALGLLDRGFRVAAVVDATDAPGVMHRQGLRRMRDAGVILVHAKGVYYEWVRTLAAARAFEAQHPDLANPPGFDL
jgi:nicotinamidase-related amidase